MEMVWVLIIEMVWVLFMYGKKVVWSI